MKKTTLITIFYTAFAANIFAIELGEATRKTELVEPDDLGSAAWSNSTDFATAAEGDLAITAVQPATFLSFLPDFGVQAIRPDLHITETNTAWYSDFATWDTWLTGRLYGTNMVDFSSAKTNSASYANVPCLVMDGVGDWLDVPALTNGATIVSYSGTATLTATPSNCVDSTAGTVYDLLLSDGSFFPLEENSGVVCYDVSGSETNVTIHADGSSIATVRGGTADKVPWMATHGGSTALYFNGINAYINTGNKFNYVHQTGIFDFQFTIILNSLSDKKVFGNNTVSSGNGFVVSLSTGKIKISIADGFGAGNYLINNTSANCYLGRNEVHIWSTDGVTVYVQVNDDAPVAVAYTRTPNNTNQASNITRIGGVGGTTDYFSGGIVSVRFDDELWYRSSDVYGATINDNVSTNTGALLNTSFLYIPAHTAGTNDVLLLGLTNPPDLAHNNGGYSFNVPAVTNTPITFADLRSGVHDVGIVTNSLGLVEEIYHVQ